MKTTPSDSSRLFLGLGDNAPPAAPGFGPGFRAANGWRRAGRGSTPAREPRGGRQRHPPEPQMAHPLGRAAHAPPASAATLFERAVDPCAGAAFLEPLRWGGCAGGFFSATRVGIQDRPRARGAAEGVDWRRVIGAVPQVVERGDALRGPLRRRKGRLRIRHAGTGQSRADRKVAGHGVQRELVADPAFLMPVAVALAPPVTTDGPVRPMIRPRPARLECQPFGRRGGGRTAPRWGRPRGRGAAATAGAGWGAGPAGASLAAASRLTGPTRLVPARVVTGCSWIGRGHRSRANGSKARRKGGSRGISPGLSQPQSRRNHGRDFKASRSARGGN